MTDESNRKLNELQQAAVAMLQEHHGYDLKFLGIDAAGDAFFDWEHLRVKIGPTGSHTVGSPEMTGGPK